jgi:hypothetical protein
MDTALVSAFSALGGSVIGGLISGVAAVASQRVQARANIVANEITRREDLYKDFIMAASTAYGDALLTNEPKVDKLVSLYALVSKMRVLLPLQIVDCADRVMVTIVETYFASNRTVREIHELVKSRGALIDPLRQFSELARNDIAELRPH